MKRKVMILMIGVLLISGSVFAQDITIDGSGNVITGTNSAGGGNLEVIGSSGEDGIRSSTSGTGAAGVYGENTSDGIGVYGYSATGNAGYFQGKAEITGNLTVGGTVTGTGVGDITAVNAGTGLSGGQTSGDVTLDADTTYLQQRVTGSCLGQVMVSINQDGTVLCETDDTGGGGGGVTSVTAGTGLSDSGTSQNVELDIDFVGTGTAETVSRSDYVESLEARIAALELLLEHFTKVNNDIYITGANLHVESGSGATDGAVNGLGNIIIGYNEAVRTIPTLSCSLGQFTDQSACEASGGTWALIHKSGSHNLIVGQNHNYSRYGGIVVGLENTISGDYASVSAGSGSTASGYTSSISGGDSNTASHFSSSVSGGSGNTASGPVSSVSGGQGSTASGVASSISGGDSNTASQFSSSVSGGSGNTGSGQWSTVSGGESNIASGMQSVVIGGQSNTASTLHEIAPVPADVGGWQ